MQNNNIIKTTREKHGLNQVDFAQKVGFSQATISKWESGFVPVRGNILDYVKRLDDDGYFNSDNVIEGLDDGR